MQLSVRKKQAKATLGIIQEEAKNLGSLVHSHIVTFIGSYEEVTHNNRHFYSLLMCPVGDNDLADFLEIAGEQDSSSELSAQWTSWIRTWFTCLASALDHMHQNGIRHQDIKPSNIIHRGDRVLFTDFSSSNAFEVGHTTSTDSPSRSSPMYAAPEVISAKLSDTLGKHGRGSDIFALGCVFCDMLTVLEHRSVSSFKKFLLDGNNTTGSDISNDKKQLYYSQSLRSIQEWFDDSQRFNNCISPMLNSHRASRPNANEVLQTFISHNMFVTSCTCWNVNNTAGNVDNTAGNVNNTAGNL